MGDSERVTALGLHRLQSGDVAGAVAVLRGMADRMAPAIDPNLTSALALALALAASGSVDEAIARAGAVEHHERASYMDRLIAGMARGLALTRSGDHAAAPALFDRVRAAADGTEDRLSQSLVRLADATAASARGGDDAVAKYEEADRRLAELGMSSTGWRQVFSLALGLGATA